MRAVFICAAVAAASSVASAETVGLIALTPDQTPVQRAALSRASRLALIGAGHQVLLDPVDNARQRVAKGAVLAERLEPFARANRLLDEGWKLYAQVQIPEAKERLLAARDAALEVADIDGGVDIVAETTLRLGVTRFELGEAEADDDFRLAHRLAGDRAVTDDEFKPAVVTAFRAAIAAPMVARPVTLEVKPSDATVEIDGATRSATGLDLEVGLHLLVVRKPGHVAVGKLATVPSTGPATISESLKPRAASAGLFAGNVEIQTSASAAQSILESTAVFAELDAVVVVAAAYKGQDSVLLAQRCAGAPLKCGPVVEAVIAQESALAIASSELMTEVGRTKPGDDGVLVPNHPVVLASVKPEIIIPIVPPDPWWKNHWLWIGVGAVAIAAGTTAVILSIDSDSPVVIIADPCDFGQCSP